uniref:Uncharacterized protein n=1 Tax=Triticum urartu TaxID=4572 RepID=A0A8R7TSI1_TRIUA
MRELLQETHEAFQRPPLDGIGLERPPDRAPGRVGLHADGRPVPAEPLVGLHHLVAVGPPRGVDLEEPLLGPADRLPRCRHVHRPRAVPDAPGPAVVALQPPARLHQGHPLVEGAEVSQQGPRLVGRRPRRRGAHGAAPLGRRRFTVRAVTVRRHVPAPGQLDR